MSNPPAQEKFREFLSTKGLRMTEQRRALFEAAMAQKDPFTAEQLLDRSRQLARKNPRLARSLSRATVYRTLPVMTESGMLREIDIGTGEKFYRPDADSPAQMAQVICLDCDRIFEISAPFMEWYGSTVSSKLGLTPLSQRLQVSARCNLFRDTGSCPRRP